MKFISFIHEVLQTKDRLLTALSNLFLTASYHFLYPATIYQFFYIQLKFKFQNATKFRNMPIKLRMKPLFPFQIVWFRPKIQQSKQVIP